MKPTFEYVTKTATEVNHKWSVKNRLLFQAFNPNGLVAQKDANDDAVRALVDEGRVMSGALITYGGFDSYSRDQLMKLVVKKRVSTSQYSVAVQMLRATVLGASEYIAHQRAK
jgi:hypothetical protein